MKTLSGASPSTGLARHTADLTCSHAPVARGIRDIPGRRGRAGPGPLLSLHLPQPCVAALRTQDLLWGSASAPLGSNETPRAAARGLPRKLSLLLLSFLSSFSLSPPLPPSTTRKTEEALRTPSASRPAGCPPWPTPEGLNDRKGGTREEGLEGSALPCPAGRDPALAPQASAASPSAVEMAAVALPLLPIGQRSRHLPPLRQGLSREPGASSPWRASSSRRGPGRTLPHEPSSAASWGPREAISAPLKTGKGHGEKAQGSPLVGRESGLLGLPPQLCEVLQPDGVAPPVPGVAPAGLPPQDPRVQEELLSLPPSR